MAKHSSATAHSETPHVLELSRTNTIMNALKQRALAVLHDESLDAESREVIRYGLETNDPWLAELVRRAEASESLTDKLHCSQTLGINEFNSKPEAETTPTEPVTSKDRIEALAEIICGAGDASAGALFVLMGMLENSTQPNVIANTVKHFAFTRCGELNLFGMVDAHLAVVEGELFAHSRTIS